MTTASRKYFATRPEDEIGKELASRIEQYASNKLVQQIDGRLQTAWQYYFGYDVDGVHSTSQVRRGGEQGELAEVRVNHSRALVNALLNLIIAPKFVWTPRAASLAYDDVRQCDLARAVLEHYWHNKKVSAFAGRAVEEAIVFTEGFVLVEWDEKAGAIDQEDPDTLPGGEGEGEEGLGVGDPMFTGDLRFTNLSSWDVIRNPNKKSWDDLDWVIARVWRNRFDLAARFPEEEEKILGIDSGGADLTNRVGMSSDSIDDDDVPLYIFFHKPSAVLPWGREVRFLADGTVLEAKQLDVDTFPLHRVSPAELTGKPFGYSPYLEILGLQEVADSVLSALTTNITTFGVQSIAAEEGSPIQVDELSGLRVIYYKGNKPPQGISFLAATGDQFGFLKDLKNNQELIMGLNAVVRGEAQSDRLSGAALALLQSQALQQASALQGNYTRMLESIGTTVVQLIGKRATVPLKIAIVGKNNLSLAQEMDVSGDKVRAVRQVYVDLGNPISQTSAGRYELGKEMLQMGLVKTPEQMQQVIDTGRLDPVTRGSHEEYLLVLRENEMLAKGEKPHALIGDNHLLHGREHNVPTSSPEARENANVLRAAREHDHEHLSLLFNVPLQGLEYDPRYHDWMLAYKGQPPPPQVATPPPPGPGAPQAPGGAGGPPGGGSDVQAPEQPVDVPVDAGGGGGNMPSLPVQPLTGNRWDPVTGGGQVPPPTANK